MSLLHNLSASCVSKNNFYANLHFRLFLAESFNEHFSKYNILQIICPPKKEQIILTKSRIGYLICINSRKKPFKFVALIF